MILVGATAAGLLSVLGASYFRASGRAKREYVRRVESIDLADIPQLATQCVSAYRSRLNVELVTFDLDASAHAVDAAMCSARAMISLSSEEHSLRGAELSGAFLGELIRHHTDAIWCRDGALPALSLRTVEGDEMLWPFIDTVNHFKAGRPGELYAMTMALVERRRALRMSAS